MNNTYTPIYKRDYNFGINQELLVKPKLEKFLNITLEKTIGKYNLFDFKGDKIYLELKSRKNNLKKFPTTIVGVNKIIKANELIKEGNKVLFVFNFLDSLDFWEYKGEEYIKDYSRRIVSRNDRPGHKGSEYLEIPIGDLLNISKK